MKQITEEHFKNYCESQGLEVVKITETPQSWYAFVRGKINTDRFTQWATKGTVRVIRLSKKDIENELITKGFFN